MTYASFFNHFNEFRVRILKSLAVFVLTSFGFYSITPQILGWLIQPAGHLIFTSPQDAFTAYIQVTLTGGFIVSLPFTVYQIWAFAAEALKPVERRTIIFFAPVSLVLFVCGVCFGFWVMVPWAYTFLLSFSSPQIVAMITVKEYIVFVTTWVLTMGIIFELPLVMVFLAHVGIASPEFLRQKRRHAIVIILIVAAIFSPPDVVSQLMVAMPLFVLYEIGVVGVRFFYKPQVA